MSVSIDQYSMNLLARETERDAEKCKVDRYSDVVKREPFSELHFMGMVAVANAYV